MSSNLVNRHPESQILNCQCRNQEVTWYTEQNLEKIYQLVLPVPLDMKVKVSYTQEDQLKYV